jgi:phospholipid/cholesterol/gamma-HCH transport system ATP-binding protein
MIELSNVNLTIDDRVILKNVTFSVEDEQIAVILGPSGAGKSSILRIILGLWKPDSGSVKIDGVDITRLSETDIFSIRKRMGMVFQANALFDSLTVAENVGYFLVENGDIDPLEIGKRVSQALDFVNLKNSEELYPSQLSGGMRKRVAIARALVARPDIVLYDEPTTGIDPINSKSIIDLIKRVRDNGATSVVVTHLLKDAIAIGDVLALLNDGEIVEQGTVEKMLNSENPFVQSFFQEFYDESEIIKLKR